MASTVESFCVGELYSNEEIYKSLGVGNAGGIRTRSDHAGRIRRMVIMTSLPDAKTLVENPYHDRLEGKTLVYTAAGKVGDQVIIGQNAKIERQVLELFPIWGFQLQSSRRNRTIGPKRWLFLGLLQYLRMYSESQVDASGQPRSAFVFEFRVRDSIEKVQVDLDIQITLTLIGEGLAEDLIDESDREVDLAAERSQVVSACDTLSLDEVRRRLLGQSPKVFETTISELLIRTGFRGVEVTRYSQDGGIDINAWPGDSAWPLGNRLVQIQAKRWMHTVGRREVAELRGSILPHSVGCIVTTSHFSRAGIAESTGDGKVPIQLINGFETARLIMKYGLLTDLR